MATEELKVQIKSLARQDWKIGSIAKHLGVHHTTVRRCLAQSDPEPQAKSSSLESWKELIEKTLIKYPDLKATRLLSILRQNGYKGSVYPVRRFCQENRPRKAKAFLDLSFMPGEMAQVDWAAFGDIQVGKHKRKLHLFLMVLAYSRNMFGRFYHDMSCARVLEGHVEGFRYFKGIPQEVLYDNMKTAVIEHVGEAVRFNSNLLELAQHYAFIPRACNPRSGWEKGRVERSVRYVRESFFAARIFEDLDDLNRQLELWLQADVLERPWADDHLLTVKEAFAKENLCALPADPFDPYEERFVRVDKKARIQFDTNQYPVDPQHVGKQLTLRATHTQVRLMTKKETLHSYPRLWTKYETLAVPGHQEQIAKLRRIKDHRMARSELEKAFNCGSELLKKWADLDEHIHQSAKRILDLIPRYGRENVEAACQLALENNTPRPCSVAHILAEGHGKPKTAIHIKVDAPDIKVEWSNVSTYDELYTRGN